MYEHRQIAHFGRNLTRLRTQKGISQRQLAECLGLRQSHIGNIEANRGLPSLEVALEIAQYFDVPLDSLTVNPEAEPAH